MRVMYLAMSRATLIAMQAQIGREMAEKPTGPIEVRIECSAGGKFDDAVDELVFSNEDMEDREDLEPMAVFVDEQ